MDLGTLNQAGTRKRDGAVRILLQQSLDAAPVLFSRNRHREQPTGGQRGNFGRTGRIDLRNQKARFSDNRFARSKGRRTVTEDASGALVIRVPLREKGHERSRVEQNAWRIHSPKPFR